MDVLSFPTLLLKVFHPFLQDVSRITKRTFEDNLPRSFLFVYYASTRFHFVFLYRTYISAFLESNMVFAVYLWLSVNIPIPSG